MIKVYQTIECKNNVITTIPFKGVKVKVEFKNGNMMKGIPARLYTSDPFVQKALDESDQKGRMYRFVQELEEGNVNVKRQQPPADQKTARPAVAKTEIPVPHKPAALDAPDPGISKTPEDDTEGEGVQKYEFDNLAEAVTYIATTWGEQVESESQVRKFIEEKTGVKPVIHKG